ncbi:MAG: reverse transcriptase-like protein, partial [Candidatus Hydrogenedentota bacterium]
MAKYRLVVYVDASCYGEDQNSIGAMVYELRKDNHLEWEQQPEKFSIGTITNSTLGEYIALEKTLQKITGKLKRNKIGLKKTEVEIRTDSQVLARQLDGTNFPSTKVKFLKCYRRIQEQLKPFKKVSVVWKSREENLAGLFLEGKLGDVGNSSEPIVLKKPESIFINVGNIFKKKVPDLINSGKSRTKEEPPF